MPDRRLSVSMRQRSPIPLDLEFACDPGDVLAIFSPNLPEYAIAFHGAALIGGIVTTINPLYTAAELTYQLKDAGAKFLLTVGPFLDKAREAAAECGLREVFVFGEAEGATSFASLLAAGGTLRRASARLRARSSGRTQGAARRAPFTRRTCSAARTCPRAHASTTGTSRTTSAVTSTVCRPRRRPVRRCWSTRRASRASDRAGFAPQVVLLAADSLVR